MSKPPIDKSTAMQLVKKDAYILEELSDEFKNDYEIVSLAVSQKPYAFGSASEDLRNNAELAILALKGNPNTMRYTGQQLMNNISFLKDAYSIDKKIAAYVVDEKMRSQLLECS